MRIGIFGGTFDPIHVGHLILAEQCREQCQLDEIWFVPAAVPPHKQDAIISPAKTRCEMIEFAISGNPRFRLSHVELARAGPSYTVETLEQLHAEDSARELFLMMGTDSVRDLPTWRNPRRILDLATLVVVNRGQDPLTEAATRQQLVETMAGSTPRVRSVRIPGIAISSTDIRQRVTEGRSIGYLVPRAVEAYILEHSVYRN